MAIRDRIYQKLSDGLSPAKIEVIDESGRHVGHAGAHPEGESHFRVEIVSAAFVGKSRVERQRMIYGLLVEELRERVHALSLNALAPDETP